MSSTNSTDVTPVRPAAAPTTRSPLSALPAHMATLTIDAKKRGRDGSGSGNPSSRKTPRESASSSDVHWSHLSWVLDELLAGNIDNVAHDDVNQLYEIWGGADKVGAALVQGAWLATLGAGTEDYEAAQRAVKEADLDERIKAHLKQVELAKNLASISDMDPGFIMEQVGESEDASTSGAAESSKAPAPVAEPPPPSGKHTPAPAADEPFALAELFGDIDEETLESITSTDANAIVRGKLIALFNQAKPGGSGSEMVIEFSEDDRKKKRPVPRFIKKFANKMISRTFDEKTRVAVKNFLDGAPLAGETYQKVKAWLETPGDVADQPVQKQSYDVDVTPDAKFAVLLGQLDGTRRVWMDKLYQVLKNKQRPTGKDRSNLVKFSNRVLFRISKANDVAVRNFLNGEELTVKVRGEVLKDMANASSSMVASVKLDGITKQS